ncbi:porin [Bordetella hinzii]|uniref:porin n=1 Tax=Bordetella hinzii TaxID=103855 RepID=UPI0039FCA478
MLRTTFAALGCGLAAGAWAQSSSLTLFGHVDMNVTAATAGGASKIGMDQGGYMIPSRFGMRGTENLGGGNSVGFWIEAPILPNNGGPQGISFTRRSTISFINPQYGELRLGRDYTAAFWNISSFSPFGTVGVGGSSNLIQGWPTGMGGASTLSRASNMLAYFLPAKLGGVYGQVNYAREQEIEGAGYAGGRLGYREGGWDIAGAYGRSAVGSRDYRHATLGSSYDFKVVKVFANYLRQTLGSERQEVALLGAAVPAGRGQIKVSYSRAWQSGPGDGDDAQQYAVGYVHPLSKRTVLYTAYSYIDNQGQAAFVTGDVSPLGQPGRHATGFQVGMSHSF